MDNLQKKILFFLLFFALVLIGQQVNFSPLLGVDNQFFTLFQFFGPIAGGFLGPLYGAIVVMFSQAADFFIVGKEATWLNLLRFLPMIFAAYYFGSKKEYVALVPLAGIALFVLHPVGREVWFYSLFWLIPVLAAMWPEKMKGKLLFRSVGSTFTAHAVGGAIWIWTVPMTAEQWVSLIPIVAYERVLFALGIAGSYIMLSTVLDYVVEKWKISLPSFLWVEKKYSLLSVVKKS